MEEQFYTILTKLGKSKVANATGLGEKVNLTKFKVGDSNGNYYNPTEEQTELRNVVYETNINSVYTDEDNPNWIVIEVVIPGNVGGFTIREAAAFDDLGNMIAIGKYPETYKPLSENGSTKDLLIKMILEVSNASVVTIKVDPTVIFASKKDLEVLENKIKKITGDKNELKTKDKSNIVNAINEVATGLNTIELTAEKVTIKDENNNFESDTVEGALLENKTRISEQGKQIESLKLSANNGKNIVATAIGEPLTSNDTFVSMANKIDTMTSNFRNTLRNKSIPVDSGDRFSKLILDVNKLYSVTLIAGDNKILYSDPVDTEYYVNNSESYKLIKTQQISTILDLPNCNLSSLRCVARIIPRNVGQTKYSCYLNIVIKDSTGSQVASKEFSVIQDYSSSQNKMTCVYDIINLSKSHYIEFYAKVVEMGSFFNSFYLDSIKITGNEVHN